MSIYDDFREAWVDHVVFGGGNARLYAARVRMLSDPDYDELRYAAALFAGERIAAAYQRSMRGRGV
jgi:hypothetical protein